MAIALYPQEIAVVAGRLLDDEPYLTPVEASAWTVRPDEPIVASYSLCVVVSGDEADYEVLIPEASLLAALVDFGRLRESVGSI